jgi:hypothetical protein
MNPVALEFTRHILRNLPADADFLVIYDAMSRAASRRDFRNLGHRELSEIGISFALTATGDLEQLIAEVRKQLNLKSQT